MRWGADLDFASWDSYPLGFLMDRAGASPEEKEQYLRQGHPDFQAFHHDLYRTCGAGRFWVMEQQPGPVNWAPWNPAPMPGMVRLWAWEAFAHGAETVCFFRWRQAPFGQEQMHAGLLLPDRRPAVGLAEVARVARELEEAPEAGAGPARCALIYDYASAHAWEAQPQGADFDYFDLCFDVYCAMRRAGLSIDVLPPEGRDLGPYALVMAPGLLECSPGFLDSLNTCKGQVVLGPRAGQKTSELAIPVPMGPNLPGLRATVTRVESLPPFADVPLAAGGVVRRWFEALETDAEVFERTRDGRPVLAGGGRVGYLAGWPMRGRWTASSGGRRRSVACPPSTCRPGSGCAIPPPTVSGSTTRARREPAAGAPWDPPACAGSLWTGHAAPGEGGAVRRRRASTGDGPG